MERRGRVLECLKNRLKENHLELNEDKTRIVEFKKVRKSILEFKLWIKANRNRHKLKELWRMAGSTRSVG